MAGLPCSAVAGLILTFPCLLAVAASALPEMETLRKRLSEVSDQITERNASFDGFVQERDRLQVIEAELNGTVERLTGELSNLRRA